MKVRRQLAPVTAALAVLAVATIWSSVQVVRAQTTTPLWRMNITANAAPSFGWGF